MLTHTHTHRPLSLDSMKMVEGVSEIWLHKYGSRFLETIAKFCQTQDMQMPMDVHKSSATQRTQPTSVTVKACTIEECMYVCIIYSSVLFSVFYSQLNDKVL